MQSLGGYVQRKKSLFFDGLVRVWSQRSKIEAPRPDTRGPKPGAFFASELPLCVLDPFDGFGLSIYQLCVCLGSRGQHNLAHLEALLILQGNTLIPF